MSLVIEPCLLGYVVVDKRENNQIQGEHIRVVGLISQPNQLSANSKSFILVHK